MPETSGDTKPVTSFTDPSLVWSEPDSTPTAAAPPAADIPQTPDTAPDSTPEPATTASAPEPTTGEAPPEGPIPLDRHKAILEAERKRTADAEAKWKRLEWADTLASSGKSPEQIQEALSLYDGIDGDPAGFLGRFYETLEAHPQYRQQMRQWAARVLAGGRARPAETPVEAADPQRDPEPTPDFQDERGVPFFSAPQLQKWEQWRERQIEARLQQRLEPLLRRHQAQEQAESERVALQAEYDRQAKILEDMRQKPFFKDHEADIKAYLAERGYNDTIERAYVHVLTTKVLPTLQAQERSATLTELKTQAAASTVKPSTAAPTTAKAPSSFFDPSLKWS